MKKIIFSSIILISLLSGFAQTTMSYQTIVRDADNKLVVNTAIDADVTIYARISGSILPPLVVFSEKHSVVSNQNGQVSLMLGTGSNQTGNLDNVNFENAYITLDMTYDGNTITKTTAFGASPLALTAENVSKDFIIDYLDANDYVVVGSSMPGTTQRDWNQTDPEAIDYIKNKPHIPAAYNTNCNDKTFCDLADLVDTLQKYYDLLKDKFSDCPATVTDIEGNVYNTVKIGTQCWTKENLRTKKLPDGTDIIVGTGVSKSDMGNGTYYMLPGGDNSDDQYVNEYGLLYSGLCVTKNYVKEDPEYVQGVCPDGWHVPNKTEWLTMLNYVKDTYGTCPENYNVYNNSSATSSETGWLEFTNTSNANYNCAPGSPATTNNVTGFSAIPAGYIANMQNTYSNFMMCAQYWGSDLYTLKWSYNLQSIEYNDSAQLRYCLSVRCLKNEE